MLVTNCKRGCITIILQGSIFHKKDKAALGSKPKEKKKKEDTENKFTANCNIWNGWAVGSYCIAQGTV